MMAKAKVKAKRKFFRAASLPIVDPCSERVLLFIAAEDSKLVTLRSWNRTTLQTEGPDRLVDVKVLRKWAKMIVKQTQ
jgi:hypothetical protein